MVSMFKIELNRRNRSCFTDKSSKTASITSWQDARRSRSVVVRIRSRIRFTSSSLNKWRDTPSSRVVRMEFNPFSRKEFSLSTRITFRPSMANFWARAEPIVPAPMIPTVWIVSIIDPSTGVYGGSRRLQSLHSHHG